LSATISKAGRGRRLFRQAVSVWDVSVWGHFGLGRFGLGRFGLGTYRSDYEILQKSYMFTF